MERDMILEEQIAWHKKIKSMSNKELVDFIISQNSLWDRIKFKLEDVWYWIKNVEF